MGINKVKNYSSNYANKVDNKKESENKNKDNLVEKIKENLIANENNQQLLIKDTPIKDGLIKNVPMKNTNIKKQNEILLVKKNDYNSGSVDFINKMVQTKKSLLVSATEKKINLGTATSPFLVAFFKHLTNIECEMMGDTKKANYSATVNEYVSKSLIESKILEEIVEQTGDEILKVLLEKLKNDI